MRFAWVFATLLLVSSALAEGLEARSLQVGSLVRTYDIYVPAGLKDKKGLPLVIMLHGRGGTGREAATNYGWTQKADKEGFIVAFPDALKDPYQNLSTWNYVYDTRYRLADDTRFLLMLIIDLKREFAADPKRIYVAGHSNGAMMAYRAASELSDLVAGIASVSGSIGPAKPGLNVIKKPRFPVSVIEFHGKKDKVLPYEGGTSLGARASVGFWIKEDACTGEAGLEKPMDDELVIETYRNGKGGAEVVLVTVVNGGHEWPTWTVRRWEPTAPEEKLTATDLIWQFFKDHPKK